MKNDLEHSKIKFQNLNLFSIAFSDNVHSHFSITEISKSKRISANLNTSLSWLKSGMH